MSHQNLSKLPDIPHIISSPTYFPDGSDTCALHEKIPETVNGEEAEGGDSSPLSNRPLDEDVPSSRTNVNETCTTCPPPVESALRRSSQAKKSPQYLNDYDISM